MKTYDDIEKGYLWINGKVMPDSLLNLYNYYQGRKRAFMDAGLPVPEQINNASHRLVSVFIST